eukprot:jgi/Mesvir1/14943/Mv14619-RA.1
MAFLQRCSSARGVMAGVTRVNWLGSLYNVVTAGTASHNYSAAAAPKMPPFAHTPAPYKGPKLEEVSKLRKEYLNPAMFVYYKNPINIVEGKMQYLFDESGRRYLDCFAGIVTVSVGHCHPAVVEATRRQNELLQHCTTIYLNANIAEYAEQMAKRMPGNLKVSYFVNSGSEANDLAMTMARVYTGNYPMVALRNGYHGMSVGTMGLTAHHTWKYNIPQGDGILHALNPDPYRGLFGNQPAKYVEEVDNLLKHGTPGKVAGFIHETIQGVGGAVPLCKDYLTEVYKMVRKAGGLCIADEVQTGFGRTGTNYWGFQNHGVLPDIVVMAKGIGNGYPLAAVVTTPEIAQAMAQKLHFNTYGGNPVASAVGKTVLEVVDREGLQVL